MASTVGHVRAQALKRFIRRGHHALQVASRKRERLAEHGYAMPRHTLLFNEKARAWTFAKCGFCARQRELCALLRTQAVLVIKHLYLCAVANVGALASSVDPSVPDPHWVFFLLPNARALACTLAWRLGACQELSIEEIKTADEFDLRQRCEATRTYVLPGVGIPFCTAA